MVFSSPIFLFYFLPCLIILYFLVPKAWKNAVLLVASIIFYTWGEGRYIGLMLASILGNHVAGWWIERQKEAGFRGRGVLVLAVAFNLGLLAFFKYFKFFSGEVTGVSEPWSDIHLPIGISFYTFQALSYVVDIYRGTSSAQKNPFQTALYISLFPQLIAGPIIRYHDVARHLAQRVSTLAGSYYGAKRFIFGLAKKVLIANPMGGIANDIFELPVGQLDGGLAWLGVSCFTLQIYFDFSGYSDMAIGLGRIFGFKFPENFNYPYISSSIREFWRRWHISLSYWFRDYLYIPLGGNQRGQVRTYLNLILVFFLCGLWHGANWTFIIWGLFHGFFLVIERVWPFQKLKLPFVNHLYTLLVVMVGWVLFNSNSMDQALAFLGAMSGFASPEKSANSIFYYVDKEGMIIFLTGVILSTPIIRTVRKRMTQWCRASSVCNMVEGGWLVILLLLCIMYLASGTYNPFLYYRF